MNDNTNKIFVGGLSWQTTSEKLSAYFNDFGEVLDVVVMTNPDTGKSRGFGFVSFKNASSVQNVLSKSQHQLDGRNIDPKECNLKNGVRLKKDASYCKIFVGGLPHDVKEETLTEFFNKYGKVTEVVIMYDQEKKKTRGFGFVSFDNEETVNRLVDERFLSLNGKKIEIKKAEPRPTLRSNSSSMTNISMQSSHNGYLPTISPYGMPLSSPQLHAAHAGMPPPSSMHNQNLNLDTSFQFAYHPNSGFNAIPIHNTAAGDSLTNQPLLAGYAPTMQTISAQPPSAQMLGNQAQWSLAAHTTINQLGQPQSHLHTQTIQPHPSMQSNSPTATNLISSTHNPSTLTSAPASLQQPHKNSALPAVQQSIVQSTSNSSGNLVQQTASTISPPNTPSSTTTNNNNQSQQTSNSNLAQLNTSSNQQQIQQQPQPSITPVPIHNLPPQNWYSNPHLYSSTPIPHPTNLLTNPNQAIAQTNQPGAQVVVPFSHSQAVTFGYPATGYVPANLNLMQVPAPWQNMNPYVYSAYPHPVSYTQPTSSPSGMMSLQSQNASTIPSQQEAKRIKLS